MFRKIILIALVMILASAAVCSFAADDEKGFGGKKWEVSGAFAWAKISDLKATVTYLKTGYFFNKNWEAELGVIYAKAEMGGPSASATILAPAAVYNFVKEGKQSNFVPYVGAGFYTSKLKAGSDSIKPSGFQWFVGGKCILDGTVANPKTALFVEYRDLPKVEAFDESNNLSSFLMGMSTYF